MARPAIKKENPLYENKADKPFSPNRARIIKAHDGLEAGVIVIGSEENIRRMVELGFWERCE